VKPDWLPKLKVLVKFVAKFNAQSVDQSRDFNLLHKLVDTCRTEIPSLETISFGEKVPVTFDYEETVRLSNVIEISTKFADFQLDFEEFNTDQKAQSITEISEEVLKKYTKLFN
jgi:hypothetical protein